MENVHSSFYASGWLTIMIQVTDKYVIDYRDAYNYVVYEKKSVPETARFDKKYIKPAYFTSFSQALTNIGERCRYDAVATLQDPSLEEAIQAVKQSNLEFEAKVEKCMKSLEINLPEEVKGMPDKC